MGFDHTCSVRIQASKARHLMGGGAVNRPAAVLLASERALLLNIRCNTSHGFASIAIHFRREKSATATFEEKKHLLAAADEDWTYSFGHYLTGRTAPKLYDLILHVCGLFNAAGLPKKHRSVARMITARDFDTGD